MTNLALTVRRRWWDAERFGLVPTKLLRRALNRTEPKVFLNSIPKSGTHLMERALCLHPRLYRRIVPTLHLGTVREGLGLADQLPRGPGQVVVGHLPYYPPWLQALEDTGCRMLFMIRDPRDVVASEMHHVLRDPEHRLHERYRRTTDPQERLLMLIRGVEGGRRPLREVLENFLPWLDVGACVVRYEELIGARGGGSDGSQRRTLIRVFDHLGLEADDRTLDRIQDRLFSDASPTFRRGATGGWRAWFDPVVAEAFRTHMGDIATALGYEDADPR